MPFEIIKADIKINRLDDSELKLEIAIDKDNVAASGGKINCMLNKSDRGKGYGVHIEMENEHMIDMEMDVDLKLNRRDLKPLFMVEKGGGKL